MDTRGSTGPVGRVPHVKICTPIYSDYDDSYKLAMLQMSEMQGLSFTWDHQSCRSCMPALARNVLTNGGTSTQVQQTLDPTYTHFLYVDYDISWWPDAIAKLLSDNRPVVSGAYVARDDPKCYQAGMWSLTKGNPGGLISRESKGLNKVDWVGAGFLLVQREVLEACEYPWWRHSMVRFIEQTQSGQKFFHQVESNEDISFCWALQEQGFDVYLDCDCFVSHALDGDPRPIALSPVGKKFGIHPGWTGMYQG